MPVKRNWVSARRNHVSGSFDANKGRRTAAAWMVCVKMIVESRPVVLSEDDILKDDGV